MKNKPGDLFLPLALSIPMLVFYLGYFYQHAPELKPTGFIQYDNVSYVAYARQYLDAGRLHLQYANPFGEQEQTPIYFQTQTLFFALLLKLGIPPGWILIPFTFICALVCFRLMIALYDKLFPDKHFRTWHIWLACWGGGLLTIAGMFYYAFSHPSLPFADGILLLDPEKGWWGLNFGRAIFFSCEAYYHAIFLGCILSVINKKWIAAILLLALLSISHPFTGLELIVIVCLASAWEWINNRRSIPLWFMVAALLILCFHIWYYLVYLERFPDHQSVSLQYTLDWKLRWYRMLPAYGVVAALAIAAIYQQGVRNFFSIRSNRILAAWFFGAFLLANHELFITARQPVHFTRGYVWTSLFLLGIPALQKLNQYLGRCFGVIGFIVLGLLFFTDNFYWIFNNIRTKSVQPYTSYINQEQEKVFDLLNEDNSNKTLLVSTDQVMGYLASVYTSSYPLYSHPYTTPFALQRWKELDDFTRKGIVDQSWLKRDVDFLVRSTDTIAFRSLLNIPSRGIIKTGHYIIFRYRP